MPRGKTKRYRLNYDLIYGKKKMEKKNKEIAFEFTGKNNKKILSYHLEKCPEGHYKNDVIGLKVTSENKSANIDVIMTPYEAFLIANALIQAVLFHEKSNKRFLK